MKKIKQKLTTKVVQCPSCQQKIRIPIRQGKTLEVRCQKCTTSFQLHFQSPFRDVFKWYPGMGLKHNSKSMFLAYKALPYKARIAFVAQLFMTVAIIIMLSTIVQKVFLAVYDLAK